MQLFHEYLRLPNLDSLVAAHQYLGNDLPIFLELYDRMRDEGIATYPTIARLVQSAGKLAILAEESLELCEQIGKLNEKKTKII